MEYARRATYYRTALLLGMVRGDEVVRWAEDAIAAEAIPHRALLEIVSTPPGDLSALRHALWPMVVDPEPVAVVEALLGRLDADLASGARSAGDSIAIVRQLRSMLRLPRDLYDELNAALVAQAVPAWLARYRDRSI
jgi:hypothetical protein